MCREKYADADSRAATTNQKACALVVIVPSLRDNTRRSHRSRCDRTTQHARGARADHEARFGRVIDQISIHVPFFTKRLIARAGIVSVMRLHRICPGE
jgi:hypothetical protein